MRRSARTAVKEPPPTAVSKGYRAGYSTQAQGGHDLWTNGLYVYTQCGRSASAQGFLCELTPLERSPILGTNHLKFEWIVPKTGPRFQKELRFSTTTGRRVQTPSDASTDLLAFRRALSKAGLVRACVFTYDTRTIFGVCILLFEGETPSEITFGNHLTYKLIPGWGGGGLPWALYIQHGIRYGTLQFSCVRYR